MSSTANVQRNDDNDIVAATQSQTQNEYVKPQSAVAVKSLQISEQGSKQNREQQPTANTSKMTDQQLKKFNFNLLSNREINFLEDLSFFTTQREFIKMFVNRHSEIRKKEFFIKENAAYLTAEDFSQYNKAKYNYQYNSTHFAAFCTAFTTFAGFSIGIYTLPSRRSPWKYTGIGLGLGLALSYGFWRFQTFRYHTNINEQFKEIIRNKLQIERSKPQLNS